MVMTSLQVPRSPVPCIRCTVDLTRRQREFNPRTPNTSLRSMIFRLFRRDPRARTIAALYGAIVAQARRPIFYLAFGVPDTAEGRFEMIALHVALLCRRLGREGEAGRSLSQGVFDMFCRDMDHNLREMGVSDLRVPKTMRKLGEAFYGRLEAYDRALAADD